MSRPGPRMREMARNIAITAEDLREAIDRDRLVLYYQPEMTADGARLQCVEALVRWEDPERGLVPPRLFVPLAEKSGLISELGAWVMRRACRDGVRWPEVAVAVNVSPLQFRDPGFFDFVRATADAAGLPFNRLEIEVTEGAYFDNVEWAMQELRKFRSLGMSVALDDFGTGYASLTYLRRLPFTKIKIDKTFVDECQVIGSAAIIHAVVALSRALGLKVTAEGVETPEQQRFLRAAGCHYLQGYLFSRPVPAREITASLEAQGQKLAS